MHSGPCGVWPRRIWTTGLALSSGRSAISADRALDLLKSLVERVHLSAKVALQSVELGHERRVLGTSRARRFATRFRDEHPARRVGHQQTFCLQYVEGMLHCLPCNAILRGQRPARGQALAGCETSALDRLAQIV